jgi:hypothetical protein
LNDYSDAIVSAIHEHGGDVLKLIGDGTLAIFAAQDRAHACDAARPRDLQKHRPHLAELVADRKSSCAKRPRRQRVDMHLSAPTTTTRKLEVRVQVIAHRSTAANERPRVVMLCGIHAYRYAALAAQTDVSINISVRLRHGISVRLGHDISVRSRHGALCRHVD